MTEQDILMQASPQFSLGTIVATPGALEALEQASQTANEFLRRHVSGDWGSLSEEDKTLNDQSLQDGSRILSAYETTKGARVWIITEADRSATTLLLPEEY